MTGNMIGRVFNNRYRITERIGIGGMAEVYQAQDEVLGRLVAVKVMLPQYAADPVFTKRFKQEAAAAANLSNPYIVNVYDWGQDDGTYYIVMEYIRGSDLKTAINERGAINQRKVAEIGAQVCQALTTAHGLDIIHRDIKPQNIMVQPDGNVKVMDFGIARAKNSVMTKTSSVLGTAHYISPEQAQGRELTAASDIYSLGVVMYEACTGQLPFDGPDAVSVAMQQVNDLPVPPCDVNPDLDPALEAIILKAMEKNPDMRFATAKDMRAALMDYLAGRPVQLGNFNSAETSVMGAMGAAGAGMAGAGIAGTAVMTAVGNGQHRDFDAGYNAPGQGRSASYRPEPDNRSGNGNGPKAVKAVLGLVLAIAAIAAIAFFVMNALGSPESDKPDAIVVPSVVDDNVDDARKKLVDLGFTVDVEEVNNDTVEPGIVISQDPTSGKKMDPGTLVKLKVSKGTEQVPVPDVRGRTADEARKLIQEAGLKAEAGAAEYSDSVDKDKVIRTSPDAGTEVSKNSTVTYYVSLGKEGSDVPSVVGKSLTDAIATLNGAGFEVDMNNLTYVSSDQPKDTVISQLPSGGSKEDKSTIVTLTLSSGPQKSTYYVSVNSNGGGTVSASASQVEEGGQVTVTITPYDGFVVASTSGIDGVSSSGGTYTIRPTGDVTIYVDFQQSQPSAPEPENPGTTNPGTTDPGTQQPGGNEGGGNGDAQGGTSAQNEAA
nr:Stk1 family PASTA domain-containing Ser/Thr kinase [Adlercreutzia aquisgranensis]